MKIVERVIFPFQEKDFFTAIRDKIEYARVVVLAARQLLLNTSKGEFVVTSSMRLVVDKMNRLFFYKDKKFFSISFPFTVILDGDEVVKITTYTGKNLDNKSISAVISILDTAEFRLNPSLIDFFIEPNSLDSSGLFLLEEIFQAEPSYIRYDFDPENANGKIHPLHHIDINYSQYGTFKLGLKKEMTMANFQNFPNTKTDCSFLID